MVIEISLGPGGAASVNNFQLNYNSFITNTESIISGFKAIKRDTYNLSGDVGNLQNALDDIETRICHEEEKKNEALNIQRKTNDFLSLAQRVDNQVADLVNQHNEEFYKTNPWARPNALLDDASSWIENAWEWICNLGNEIEKGIRSINAFLDEHSFEILITVCSFALCFAFPAAAPWILGASGALLSAVSSIKSQLKEKDNVVWETVFLEALIGGTVGATTAWLGAGIGNAITKTLTTKFLSTSASTLTRVLISSTVGAVSETGSGIITRGVASATEDFIKTGEVQFEDVTQEAFDLKQMLLDAFLGSVIGGANEYNQINSIEKSNDVLIEQNDSTKNISSDNRSELQSQKNIDADKLMQDLYEQNIRKKRLPKIKGAWSNPETPGTGIFIPEDNVVCKKVGMTYGELKKKYNFEGIEYHNNNPIFIPFEDPILGHVELDDFSPYRKNNGGTYELAKSKLSEKTGMSITEIEQYMDAKKLTFHEEPNMKTVRIIPTEINYAFAHTGGIGIQKSIDAMGTGMVQRLKENHPLGPDKYQSITIVKNIGSIEHVEDFNIKRIKSALGSYNRKIQHQLYPK